MLNTKNHKLNIFFTIFLDYSYKYKSIYVSKDLSVKLKSNFLINEHTYKTKVTTEDNKVPKT